MSQDMLGSVVKKLVTLPTEVFGIVYDLLEKMNNQEWVEATKKFLRKENPWGISPFTFRIWKTVKLGTGLKSADDFRKDISSLGQRIQKEADDILSKVEIADEEMELDLVKVSVEALGFRDGGTQ